MSQAAAPATPPSTPRHIPERSCVACRRKAPQGELLRLSKDTSGQWQLGKRGGRGVYLCSNAACWQEKRLRRSFGVQATRLSGELLERSQPQSLPET